MLPTPLYQFDKYLLQIVRLFLRSQPTPRPSPSQEGKDRVRSHNELLQYQFLGRKFSFLSKGHFRQNLFIALIIHHILFSNWYYFPTPLSVS
ncbi:hypothetical protein [Okeania sp. SIO2B9]|uniref:hypothetical protein n=1 Tax=Okeania sp. SIO2B9 TaxID=2607782 RepID=UPI00257BB686|nr:hypothetical protein [Okeania sp. SIO2B9]